MRGRAELGSGPVLLVVALVALALVGTVVVVLRMGGTSEAGPVAGATLAEPADSRSCPLVAIRRHRRAGPAPASAAGEVTVDVAGKVRRPGVTTLPAGHAWSTPCGARVAREVGVDLSSLNLARVLVDGEQILVGPGGPGGRLAAGASTAAPDPAGALVNLNSATAEQLETLARRRPRHCPEDPGLAHRARRLLLVDELLEVDGIGEKTLADLAPHVTL